MGVPLARPGQEELFKARAQGTPLTPAADDLGIGGIDGL
jgi:hypothetical protein